MSSTNLDQVEVLPSASRGPSRTVLCVDDETSILSAMKRLFRPCGYRVLTAESGAAALALFEAESIDLIISDMRMPEMSGAELLAQVRVRWPGVSSRLR